MTDPEPGRPLHRATPEGDGHQPSSSFLFLFNARSTRFASGLEEGRDRGDARIRNRAEKNNRTLVEKSPLDACSQDDWVQRDHVDDVTGNLSRLNKYLDDGKRLIPDSPRRDERTRYEIHVEDEAVALLECSFGLLGAFFLVNPDDRFGLLTSDAD